MACLLIHEELHERVNFFPFFHSKYLLKFGIKKNKNKKVWDHVIIKNPIHQNKE